MPPARPARCAPGRRCVHIGAARHLAHAVPLSAETLAPGQSGWAQLVFDAPVCAMPGDRYIVRNAQATRTVGGGRVLDPNAPDRKRRAPARLQWLRALAAMLDGADLAPLLEQATLGLDEAALQRLTGRDARAGGACRGAMAGRPHAAGAPHADPGRAVGCAARQGRAGAGGLPSGRARRAWPDGARLRRMALPAMPDALWQVLLDDLQAQGRIARNGPWLHLPGHAATLSDDETALAGALLPLLAEGRYDPPWVRDLAPARGEPEERAAAIAQTAAAWRGGAGGRICSITVTRARAGDAARGLAAAPAGSTPRRSATRPAWGASARSRSWSSSIASATRGACATITCYAAKAPTRLASGGRAGIIGGPSRKASVPGGTAGLQTRLGRQTFPGSTPAAFRHPSCARCRARRASGPQHARDHAADAVGLPVQFAQMPLRRAASVDQVVGRQTHRIPCLGRRAVAVVQHRAGDRPFGEKVLTFASDSPTFTATSRRPSSRCRRAIADISGISSRQGSHQVAQKLSITTLPRQAESLCSRPDRSGRISGGVGEVQAAQSGPVADLSASSGRRAPPAAARPARGPIAGSGGG